MGLRAPLSARYDELTVVDRAAAVLRAVTLWLERSGDTPWHDHVHLWVRRLTTTPRPSTRRPASPATGGTGRKDVRA